MCTQRGKPTLMVTGLHLLYLHKRGLPQQRTGNEKDPAVPAFFGLNLDCVGRKGHALGDPQFHPFSFHNIMSGLVLGFSTLDEGDGNPASAAAHGCTNDMPGISHGFKDIACLAAY